MDSHDAAPTGPLVGGVRLMPAVGLSATGSVSTMVDGKGPAQLASLGFVGACMGLPDVGSVMRARAATGHGEQPGKALRDLQRSALAAPAALAAAAVPRGKRPARIDCGLDTELQSPALEVQREAVKLSMQPYLWSWHATAAETGPARSSSTAEWASARLLAAPAGMNAMMWLRYNLSLCEVWGWVAGHGARKPLALGASAPSQQQQQRALQATTLDDVEQVMACNPAMHMALPTVARKAAQSDAAPVPLHTFVSRLQEAIVPALQPLGMSGITEAGAGMEAGSPSAGTSDAQWAGQTLRASFALGWRTQARGMSALPTVRFSDGSCARATLGLPLCVQLAAQQGAWSRAAGLLVWLAASWDRVEPQVAGLVPPQAHPHQGRPVNTASWLVSAADLCAEAALGCMAQLVALGPLQLGWGGQVCLQLASVASGFLAVLVAFLSEEVGVVYAPPSSPPRSSDAATSPDPTRDVLGAAALAQVRDLVQGTLRGCAQEGCLGATDAPPPRQPLWQRLAAPLAARLSHPVDGAPRGVTGAFPYLRYALELLLCRAGASPDPTAGGACLDDQGVLLSDRVTLALWRLPAPDARAAVCRLVRGVASPSSGQGTPALLEAAISLEALPIVGLNPAWVVAGVSAPTGPSLPVRCLARVVDVVGDVQTAALLGRLLDPMAMSQSDAEATLRWMGAYTQLLLRWRMGQAQASFLTGRSHIVQRYILLRGGDGAPLAHPFYNRCGVGRPGQPRPVPRHPALAGVGQGPGMSQELVTKAGQLVTLQRAPGPATTLPKRTSQPSAPGEVTVGLKLPLPELALAMPAGPLGRRQHLLRLVCCALYSPSELPTSVLEYLRRSGAPTGGAGAPALTKSPLPAKTAKRPSWRMKASKDAQQARQHSMGHSFHMGVQEDSVPVGAAQHPAGGVAAALGGGLPSPAWTVSMLAAASSGPSHPTAADAIANRRRAASSHAAGPHSTLHGGSMLSAQRRSSPSGEGAWPPPVSPCAALLASDTVTSTPGVGPLCSHCSSPLTLPDIQRKALHSHWLRDLPPNLAVAICCRNRLPRCSLSLLPLRVVNPYKQLSTASDRGRWKPHESGDPAQVGAEGGVAWVVVPSAIELASASQRTSAKYEDVLVPSTFTSVQREEMWEVCLHCGHGGKAGFMEGWFATNTVCVVSGCQCQCGSLDQQFRKTPVTAPLKGSEALARAKWLADAMGWQAQMGELD